MVANLLGQMGGGGKSWCWGGDMAVRYLVAMAPRVSESVDLGNLMSTVDLRDGVGCTALFAEPVETIMKFR